MGFVIGCDVGSQSLKGVLVSPDGLTVAEASAEYPMSFPEPGHAEQDAEAWLIALASVIQRLVQDAALTAKDIGTLGLAAQLDGFVPVGTGGATLGPAVIWMDRRAADECALLSETVASALVFEITGLNLDASHVAPKVMWLRRHNPRLFAACSWFPSPASFVVERLTGNRIIDRTNASSTMLYDVRANAWSDRLFEATGLDAGHFGRITDSGEVVGRLTESAAAMLGLTPSTKVIAGCGDDHGGSLGAGLVHAGMIGDVVGTAEPVTATFANPVFDSSRLVETHAHAAADLWLIENPGFVSGGSIRWFSELTGVADPIEFARLAEAAPAGAKGVLFLPCLGGATAPVWDDRARGAFCGLTLGHDRSDLARAVLEGCSFAFRDITDRLVELGVPAGEAARVVGGGSRSQVWCQIKADVTGRPLRAVATQHATAIGAAMMAAVAEGEFSSLAEAAGPLVSLGESFEPRPELRSVYDDAYGRYRESFAALQAVGSPA
ncbi:MAG TPA: FGGY family carbohydrate kinase [Patescibacteria group bacterium]|nr:FGGY family carbohydrate kinase [Patescibacteria group bacterium]